MTDPIADMLTRMRNALKVGKTEVEVPISKLKFEIAKILEKNGWVENVEKKDKNINITFKYQKGSPVINYLKRISSPGCRIYAKYKEMPIVLDGLGVAIISTPQGIMTNNEARKNKIGGEILCEIY